MASGKMITPFDSDFYRLPFKDMIGEKGKLEYDKFVKRLGVKLAPFGSLDYQEALKDPNSPESQSLRDFEALQYLWEIHLHMEFLSLDELFDKKRDEYDYDDWCMRPYYDYDDEDDAFWSGVEKKDPEVELAFNFQAKLGTNYFNQASLAKNYADDYFKVTDKNHKSLLETAEQEAAAIADPQQRRDIMAVIEDRRQAWDMHARNRENMEPVRRSHEIAKAAGIIERDHKDIDPIQEEKNKAVKAQLIAKVSEGEINKKLPNNPKLQGICAKAHAEMAAKEAEYRNKKAELVAEERSIKLEMEKAGYKTTLHHLPRYPTNGNGSPSAHRPSAPSPSDDTPPTRPRMK